MRLLREAGAARWFIASVVALAALSSSATVIVAWNLAWFISQVFIYSVPFAQVSGALWFIGVAGLVRAAVIWLQELLAQKSANAVKVQLREKYFLAVTKLGPRWLAKNSIAEVNTLATSGLDALDAYFAKYLPQLVYTAIITPVFIVLIFMADFTSGLVVIFTLPLIPLFMILIGWATRSVQQRQFDALNRLTGHFLEVMRGLTTLRIFGRAQAQVQTLALVSEQHRKRTMKVLRISFLSGFALELLASLSVALIAVSIGLRLVNSEISLLIGLFVLILAPEAYLPIRQVGTNFHAAAEGVTASKSILDTIDLSRDQLVPNFAFKSMRSAHQPNLQAVSNFEAGKFTALVGPSGSGKTTLIRQLVGIDDLDQKRLSAVAWAPQGSFLTQGTVLSNVVGPETADEAKLIQATKLAGLDDLVATSLIGPSGRGVSGGQAQRIVLARAFYRALTKNVTYLVVDEPISAQDSRRAQIIIESLAWFARQGLTVVAVAHQSALTSAADQVVEVEVADA